VDGDMKLTDFNNLTNFGIEDPRMTTIGGVAFRHLDRLPRVGDSISIEDTLITILEMDEHRIHRVRVNRGGRVEESGDDETPEESGITGATGTDDGTMADVLPGDSEAGKGGGAADTGTDTTDDGGDAITDAGENRQDPQRKANY